MKVGTDALLLGSWARVDGCKAILDAGTGSGIVGLMAAQRAPLAQLTGVEIEPNAANQAAENAQSSPFHSRVSIVNSSLQEWVDREGETRRFDVVLSNPPFFHGKPKSPILERNLARHDDTLSVEDLVRSAAALLRGGGSLQTVYPMDRWEALKSQCLAQGFNCKEVVWVRGVAGRPVTRVLSHWQLNAEIENLNHVKCSPLELQESELAIELGTRTDGKPTLSPSYIHLLAPYIDL